MTRRLTRLSTALAAGLIGAALPLVVAPAAHAAECTDETHNTANPLGHTGCDDPEPPVTTITQVEPTPTVFGYTRSKSLTFTFTGAHTDTDTDTVTFECQLYSTATPPSGWDACTSPKTYTGLADSTTNPYTFRVRAIDQKDAGLQACDAEFDVFDPLCLGDADLADHDLTPATRSIRIDTTAPNTFLTNEPFDPIRPDWPVVNTPSPTVQLNSNEVASFACTLNGRAYTPCNKGTVTLTNLAGGNYTFLARAYDRALNLDPTPVSTTFYVPTNIKRSKNSGWKRVREAGLFGNDYLTSSKVGQTLVLPAVKKVREVRLLAPTGPNYGKVEVRIGTSQWYTVNLASTKTVRLAQLVVRNEYSPKRSGQILIRVKQLDPKHPTVRIDAIVARSNVGAPPTN